MERLRELFEGGETDICSLIEEAIAIAASEYPQELMAGRERIAQRLFSFGYVRCGECNALTLAGADNIKGGVAAQGQHNHHAKENNGIHGERRRAIHNHSHSHYTCYDEAEAITEEIEEESENIREVERIKGILLDPQESEYQVKECLRRLELMEVSVDTLEVTQIGRVVNRLRRGHSQQVRSMAEMLVNDWKKLADAWKETAALGPSSSSEDVKDGENGLSYPPFDEGAFLTARTVPIKMSEIFDGMDDNGNIPTIDGNVKEQRIINLHSQNQQSTHCNRNSMNVSTRAIGSSLPSHKLKLKEHGDRGRPLMDPSKNQMNPTSVQPQIDNVRFEPGKRKMLNEEYQLAEKAKKRRPIKFIEPEDLPDIGRNFMKSSKAKRGSHSRQQSGSRR